MISVQKCARFRAFFYLWTIAALLPVALVHAQENGEPAAVEDAQAEASTVIYGEEFFALYPNAVNAADLVRRIPGGNQLLQSERMSRRGFSANRDSILINGRRLSGKGNDSGSALERITVDQILRIELIRGSSPDIKITSQKTLVNVVLKSDDSGGSGSWEVKARKPFGANVEPGGLISYGDTVGRLEYFASFEFKPHSRPARSIEKNFDENDVFVSQLNETIPKKQWQLTASINLTYTFANGDPLHLNGQYELGKQREIFRGTNFIPDDLGGLTQTGTSRRISDRRSPSFEIGGDWETDIGSEVLWKVLALYSRTDTTFSQGEDFDITGAAPEDDVFSLIDNYMTEAIVRTSAVWTLSKNHTLEIGTEVAVNKLNSSLEFSLRENGVLVPQDVAAGNIGVKEIRDESFIIHTWQLNKDMQLVSTLAAEYSKITLSGDATNQPSFFFIKPRIDYFYNITPTDQFQFSFRHDVGQLNFRDFASSVNADDEVSGGNADLRPWQSWDVEIAFEHRLANDEGSFKLTANSFTIIDVPAQVEVAPGVSGPGNATGGQAWGIRLDTSLRMTALGLREMVLETETEYSRVMQDDPFTGERVRGFGGQRIRASVVLSQDIPKWGLSYSIRLRRQAKGVFFDINEKTVFAGPQYIGMMTIEKKLWRNLIAEFGFSSFFRSNNGRERFLFENGRAGGVLTSRQLRDRRSARTVQLSLKSIF